MYCYLLINGQFVNGGYFDTMDVDRIDIRLAQVVLQTTHGKERIYISSRPNVIYNNAIWFEEDDSELAKNAFGDMLRNRYFEKRDKLKAEYDHAMNVLDASYRRQCPTISDLNNFAKK